MSDKILDYHVNMEITVDGKPLGMNEFVQSIFQSTIKGLISALKIPDDGKKITLKVDLKR
jgi:hypothetical protein